MTLFHEGHFQAGSVLKPAAYVVWEADAVVGPPDRPRGSARLQQGTRDRADLDPRLKKRCAGHTHVAEDDDPKAASGSTSKPPMAHGDERDLRTPGWTISAHSLRSRRGGSSSRATSTPPRGLLTSSSTTCDQGWGSVGSGVSDGAETLIRYNRRAIITVGSAYTLSQECGRKRRGSKLELSRSTRRTSSRCWEIPARKNGWEIGATLQ